MTAKRLFLALWLLAGTVFLAFILKPIFTGSNPLVIWLADIFGARGAEDILDLVLLLNAAVYFVIVCLLTFSVLQLKKKIIR